jgi:Outer membrane protein beta-barrel domain
MRSFSIALFLAAVVALGLVPLPVWAQTDVAVSVYGAFHQTSQSSYTRQSPSDQTGVLFEARHIWNPLAGFEGTYAYNRADQTYSSPQTSACPAGTTPGCPQIVSASVPANAHEVTGDWLVSAKRQHFRFFALAGGGLRFDVPAAANASLVVNCTPSGATCLPGDVDSFTRSQTKGVFVYGAGLDWTILPHLGLRFQYRGDVYKAPALIDSFSSTGKFTQTAEPVLGAFFRF